MQHIYKNHDRLFPVGAPIPLHHPFMHNSRCPLVRPSRPTSGGFMGTTSFSGPRAAAYVGAMLVSNWKSLCVSRPLISTTRTLTDIRRPDPDQDTFRTPRPQPRVVAPHLILVRYNTVRYPEAIVVLAPSRASQKGFGECKTYFFSMARHSLACISSLSAYFSRCIHLTR